LLNCYLTIIIFATGLEAQLLSVVLTLPSSHSVRIQIGIAHACEQSMFDATGVKSADQILLRVDVGVFDWSPNADISGYPVFS